MIGVLGSVEDARVGGDRFLADDECVRVGVQQAGGDGDLGLAVGDRHEVAGVLLHHLVSGEGFESGVDELVGGFLQHGQDGLGIHASDPSGPGGPAMSPS